jgi:CheY-like chemotaxis protein
VKVASREFLEAGLRLVLRFCSRRFEVGARQPEIERKIALRVEQIEQKVRIIILDQAAKYTPEQFQLWLQGQEIAKGVPRSESSLKALQKLAALSKGRFFMDEQDRGDNGYNNAMVLELDSIQLSTSVNIAEGDGWALLVDDRLEMTAFYAKVAEALEVQPERASSVQEAREIVIKRGMPKIVVSDIELGQESGLDLVREIRAQFGAKIPIIVVSGHNDADIANQAISAGATKYLAKPVGRNRLFNEIKALLG